MKKSMIFMLIGCLVLLLSSSIFAVDPPTGISYDHTGEGDLDLTGQTATSADVGDTAQLKAYVTPYAKICFGSQLTKSGNDYVVADTTKGLIFSGRGNEEKEGKIIYTLETNCDVYVDGFGTAFKGNTYGNFLATAYKLIPANDNGSVNPGLVDGWRSINAAGYVWAPEAFDHKYVPATGSQQTGNPGVYEVAFKATTGPNISSQRAGNYTATYTVTVWSPSALN